MHLKTNGIVMLFSWNLTILPIFENLLFESKASRDEGKCFLFKKVKKWIYTQQVHRKSQILVFFATFTPQVGSKVRCSNLGEGSKYLPRKQIGLEVVRLYGQHHFLSQRNSVRSWLQFWYNARKSFRSSDGQMLSFHGFLVLISLRSQLFAFFTLLRKN